MQDYNYGYKQSSSRPGYQDKYEMELDPEFELELDNEGGDNYEFEMGSANEFESGHIGNYETANELEMEGEADYESNFDGEKEYDNEMEESYGNYENNYEYEMEEPANYEMEFENGNQNEAAEYEGYNNEGESELEAELGYITNEQELANWVNEIAVRDHRTRRIVNTPLGRSAVKQFSKIAVKTLPGIGAAAGGWRGRIRPYSTGQRTIPSGRPSNYQSNWYYRSRANQPYNYRMRNTPYGRGYYPSYRQGDPRRFIRFIRDAFGNIVRRLPRSAYYRNDTDLLRNAIIPAAATNYPVILQPMDQTIPAQDMNDMDPSMQMQDAMSDQPAVDQSQGVPPPMNPGSDKAANGSHGAIQGEINDMEESFNEVSEMELASELLSVNGEQEMDYFLSGLIKKAVGAFSDLANSPSGKILKDMLKKVAKKAIPMLSTAAGGFLGGPLGAQAGAAIGNNAAKMFELELEGLSGEDKDFEVAKAFVRLAGNAAKQGDEIRTGDPVQDARQAMIEASKRFAPGMLIEQGQQNHNYGQQQSGRWQRRGNKLIIEGMF